MARQTDFFIGWCPQGSNRSRYIMRMQLVDIGANLTHPAFRDDFDAVMARARQAGVAQIIVTGTTVQESQAAFALAASHSDALYATAGVHPHHARDCDSL